MVERSEKLGNISAIPYLKMLLASICGAVYESCSRGGYSCACHHSCGSCCCPAFEVRIASDWTLLSLPLALALALALAVSVVLLQHTGPAVGLPLTHLLTTMILLLQV